MIAEAATVAEISIALATYNGATFIDEQLASLASQQYLPAELVVCDDASTDDTIDRVRAFAATAPFPVRIEINRERLGYRENFMRAAGLCSSQLIAFCDQDDVWYPDKLARVAARFDAADVMMVHHNARLVDAGGRVIGRVTDWDGVCDTDIPAMAASPWTYPQGFAMTFRRELLALSPMRENSLDYQTKTDSMAHDQWIYVLALVFGRVRFIADSLVDYRQHGNNAYGIARPIKSRRVRLIEKFEKFSDYVRYADASAAIAKALRDGSPMLSEQTWRARAATAAVSFDDLARLYRRRATAYRDGSPVRRLRSWIGLAREGRYSGRAVWSFDPHELYRDFVLGVCLAKLRRRTGLDPFRDWSLRTNGSIT